MGAPFGPLLLLTIAILTFSPALGRLEFIQPVPPKEGITQVRIHTGAEKGLRVVTVKAIDRDAPSATVHYKLLEDGDGHFTVNSVSGDLRTNRALDNVEAGQAIKLLVVAAGDGQTTSLQLEVNVTEFNGQAPVFEKESYGAEVSEDLPVGSVIVRVKATDQDEAEYNRDIGYRLEEPSAWVRVDKDTGEVRVSRRLSAAMAPWMELHVVAEDKGSPPRAAKAKLDIGVKSLAPPRDVRWENSSASSAKICWSAPDRGIVHGYLVRYRDADRTKEQVHTFNVTAMERVRGNKTGFPATDGSQDLEPQCIRLEGLRGGTHYEFRLYAWNGQEVGLGTQLFVLSTMANPCETKVCGDHGTCRETEEDPWFECECREGFKGKKCSQVDPCAPSPCLNLGTCSASSSSSLPVSSPPVATCSCLPGFYGHDCGHLDPCAVGVAACLNGGKCQSDFSHSYTCICPPGFHGSTCQRRDPCVNADTAKPTCGPNAASCRNISDTEFVCECVPGFKGVHCETNIDECASNPCQNGAQCEDRRNGFACKCPVGFTGQFCEEDINECLVNPCENGGTCIEGEGHFSCNCADGFLGPTCRENINECSSSPCLNGGTCIDGAGGFVCKCTPSYRGIVCNLQNFCTESEVETDRGIFKFNATLPGKHAKAPCPYGSVKTSEDGVARRICLLLVMDSPAVRWGNVEDSACRHKDMHKVDQVTDQLQTLTSNGSSLNVDQVKKATTDLESVIDFATEDRTAANNVAKVISNVLDADVASFGEVEGEQTIHKRLSSLMRRIASESPLEPGETFAVNTANVVMKAKAVMTEEEINFSSFPESNSTIGIPAEAVRRGIQGPNSRVHLIAYTNAKLFREAHEEKGMARYTPARRPVYEISLGNATVGNLTDRVHYSVKKPLHGVWLCVFWDETRGVWSTVGVSTNQTEDTAFCESNHMTAFSILMDPNPNDGLSAEQQFSLSIISYIGCCLSVIGLSLTILTYALFKSLNRDRAGKILLNLCVSLLLLNLSFLSGALQSATGTAAGLCTVIAILTHYFLLTSLGWMCVEATHMYQLLVYVFATGETRFFIKRLIITWGVPFVVVGVTAVVSIGSYNSSNEYCMLSPVNAYVYYITFLGPMCLLLLVNTVVFVMVARILFQPHMASKVPIVPAKSALSHRPPRVTWAQVRGAFTVMTLLGIAWVFGAFAVGPAKVLFQYIFCILNSLQGALIFFVRCVHYPEARSAWIHLWRTGQRKRTRGTPSAHLVNTSSTASTVTSGGSGAPNNTVRSKLFKCAATRFRKGSKPTNDTPEPTDPVTQETEEKVEERPVSQGERATKAWVYGGPTEVTATEGTFMATLRNAPQNDKRRPPSPVTEKLNLKEGRDTGWQYLDLQPEGMLFIEDTEEDSVAGVTLAEKDLIPLEDATVSRNSDQGYFSAKNSPKPKTTDRRGHLEESHHL